MSKLDIDLPLKENLSEDGFYNGSFDIKNFVEPAGLRTVINRKKTIKDRLKSLRDKLNGSGFNPPSNVFESKLKESEQYRFHFDASKCIGCECCVVACNEQNNNSAEVTWRRVGEVETNAYPDTKRMFLSMGCNHCLEPSCLNGCPTDAYYKDEETGVVRHRADVCIGCQYCIWNCAYGVPQFNEERRVVTKCDMCYNRLSNSQMPACVDSCPENAISIEKVDKEEWRRSFAEANAPGLPNANLTISTTRITLPQGVGNDAQAVNAYRFKKEHSHTSLIIFLVLTQLSVGGFISLWALDLFSNILNLFKQSASYIFLTMFSIAALALNTAVFHLGRPIYAYRALKMWRRSWLSREILMFSLFSMSAFLYTALRLEQMYLGVLPAIDWANYLVGALVTLFGLLGIVTSAYIYMVPARPSWRLKTTLVQFFQTSFILGPTFTIMILLLLGLNISLSANVVNDFIALSFVASLSQLLIFGRNLLYNYQEKNRELRGTAQLYLTEFKKLTLLRGATLALSIILLPLLFVLLSSSSRVELTMLSVLIFVVQLVSEFVSRYLFFVTSVALNMAGDHFEH